MINKITGWIFGDIEHLDPAEAGALTNHEAGHDLHRQGSACRKRDHGDRHDACRDRLIAINLNHNTEQKKKETTPWEYSAFSPSSE